MAWYDALIGGVGSFIAGGAEALVKARSGPDLAPANTPIPPQPPGPDAELQSLLFDPFALLDTLGYREKASAITYDMLKLMAVKIPVMPGILQTRLNQVARFNKPQRDDTKSGFELVLRDPDEEITRQDKIRMRELAQWIVSCGSTKTLSRDTFGTFLRKFTGDSLVLDQATFEIVENNIGVPADFYAVDGGSFRIADTAWNGRPDQEDDQIRYVQVHDESVIAELTPKQLCFGVRNPRTDLRVNGYGCSEMEMAANIVTSMLNGYTYNSKYFCISGDVLIPTSLGILSAEALAGEEFKIWNGLEYKRARGYETGPRPLVRTKLWNGLETKTSPDHRFKIIPRESESLESVWAKQNSLKSGDYIFVDLACNDAPMDYDKVLIGKHYQVDRCTAFEWKATAEIVDDPVFWELIGFALGDGYFPDFRKRSANWMRIFPHYEKDADVFTRLLDCCNRHGIHANMVTVNKHVQRSDGEYGYPAIEIGHPAFVQWLYDIGFRSSTEGKRIPQTIFALPAWVRCAVLRGLFSADGYTSHHVTGYRTPTVHSSAQPLKQDILKCLWSVGVASNEVGTGWDRFGNINIQDVSAFVERIGYLQDYKNANIVRSKRSKDRWDGLHPGYQRALAKLIKSSDKWLSLPAKDRQQIGQIAYGNQRMSRPRAIRFLNKVGIAVPDELRYCQVPVDVMDIKPIDHVQMFDIEVFDDEHMFVGDFMAIHNSQGSSAKGMWNLPDISDAKVRIFARQWHMITSGILNVWRTPVTNFKDAQWIDLHKSNRDMEFGEWMNFNIKLFTAAYCIDPAEIHFQYGNTGQAQQLFQSPETQKLKASKDKGLIPLMEFIAECINKWLIWRIDERFEFRFTGLDPKDGEKSIDIEKKKVSYLMTVNELRKENDLPELEPELGDVILDPTWMQNKSAIDAAAQQEEMMAQQEQEQGTPEEPEESEAQEKSQKNEWEKCLDDAMSKAIENCKLTGSAPGETLRKSLPKPSKTAHVRETHQGDTVEYEIEF